MLVQFLWNLLFSFLLHLCFYQTSLDELMNTLQPILSLASVSTYARPRHQKSFLNLRNTVILLNLRSARINLVQEGFEYKNCLVFDASSLLDFTKFCAG